MKKFWDKLKTMKSNVVNDTTEEVIDKVKGTVVKHMNKAMPFLVVAVFALAVLTGGSSRVASAIATVAEKGGSIIVNQYGGTLNIH